MTDSLLNHERPPAFCPGCSHTKVVDALDRTLVKLGLAGNRVVLVSDIGCSGLFDTFFNTHALHGLHGRALTYATGIKLAKPELTVIVTMGDGGLGIGCAHVVSACRRNINLTLLVLNNFNFGMTGGQCSVTTPPEANVDSGFLNRLEQPLDICRLAGVAGAGFVSRASAYAAGLEETLIDAINYQGFSVVDIWGICTGRYTRHNQMSPKSIAAQLETMPSLEAFSINRSREEYVRAYADQASKVQAAAPLTEIKPSFEPLIKKRREVLFLGDAGQRVITAGELLCLAGITAGLYATQKNDYPITVMRGHVISEMILSQTPIDFTGIDIPQIVVAIGEEGINRRRKLFEHLSESTLILAADKINIPSTKGRIQRLDFKGLKIKSSQLALTALAWLAVDSHIINKEMLLCALNLKFTDTARQSTLTFIESAVAAIKKSH